jgi:hypothetical protein
MESELFHFVISFEAAREFAILSFLDGCSVKDLFKYGRIVTNNLHSASLFEIRVVFHLFKTILPLELGIDLALDLASDTVLLNLLGC